MQITYESISDIGLKRTVNQDAVLTKAGNDWGLFIVADGMGGHSEGERASNEIVKAYTEWISEADPGFEHYDLPELIGCLKETAGIANRRIFEATLPGQKCGSTLAALMVAGNFFIILSAGDSRCYDLKKYFFRTKLHQLTKDDVWGKIGGSDSSMEGKLTNAVGIRPGLQINVLTGELKKNHVFLLCSDGIYKFCDENDLRDCLKKTARNGCIGMVEELKKAVYHNGAKDNLSAIIVSVQE